MEDKNASKPKSSKPVKLIRPKLSTPTSISTPISLTNDDVNAIESNKLSAVKFAESILQQSATSEVSGISSPLLSGKTDVISENVKAIQEPSKEGLGSLASYGLIRNVENEESLVTANPISSFSSEVNDSSKKGDISVKISYTEEVTNNLASNSDITSMNSEVNDVREFPRASTPSEPNAEKPRIVLKLSRNSDKSFTSNVESNLVRRNLAEEIPHYEGNENAQTPLNSSFNEEKTVPVSTKLSPEKSSCDSKNVKFPMEPKNAENIRKVKGLINEELRKNDLPKTNEFEKSESINNSLLKQVQKFQDESSDSTEIKKSKHIDSVATQNVIKENELRERVTEKNECVMISNELEESEMCKNVSLASSTIKNPIKNLPAVALIEKNISKCETRISDVVENDVAAISQEVKSDETISVTEKIDHIVFSNTGKTNVGIPDNADAKEIVCDKKIDPPKTDVAEMKKQQPDKIASDKLENASPIKIVSAPAEENVKCIKEITVCNESNKNVAALLEIKKANEIVRCTPKIDESECIKNDLKTQAIPATDEITKTKSRDIAVVSTEIDESKSKGILADPIKINKTEFGDTVSISIQTNEKVVPLKIKKPNEHISISCESVPVTAQSPIKIKIANDITSTIAGKDIPESNKKVSSTQYEKCVSNEGVPTTKNSTKINPIESIPSVISGEKQKENTDAPSVVERIKLNETGNVEPSESKTLIPAESNQIKPGKNVSVGNNEIDKQASNKIHPIRSNNDNVSASSDIEEKTNKDDFSASTAQIIHLRIPSSKETDLQISTAKESHLQIPTATEINSQISAPDGASDVLVESQKGEEIKTVKKKGRPRKQKEPESAQPPAEEINVSEKRSTRHSQRVPTPSACFQVEMSPPQSNKFKAKRKSDHPDDENSEKNTSGDPNINVSEPSKTLHGAGAISTLPTSPEVIKKIKMHLSSQKNTPSTGKALPTSQDLPHRTNWTKGVKISKANGPLPCGVKPTTFQNLETLLKNREVKGAPVTEPTKPSWESSVERLMRASNITITPVISIPKSILPSGTPLKSTSVAPASKITKLATSGAVSSSSVSRVQIDTEKQNVRLTTNTPTTAQVPVDVKLEIRKKLALQKTFQSPVKKLPELRKLEIRPTSGQDSNLKLDAPPENIDSIVKNEPLGSPEANTPDISVDSSVISADTSSLSTSDIKPVKRRGRPRKLQSTQNSNEFDKPATVTLDIGSENPFKMFGKDVAVSDPSESTQSPDVNGGHFMSMLSTPLFDMTESDMSLEDSSRLMLKKRAHDQMDCANVETPKIKRGRKTKEEKAAMEANSGIIDFAKEQEETKRLEEQRIKKEELKEKKQKEREELRKQRVQERLELVKQKKEKEKARAEQRKQASLEKKAKLQEEKERLEEELKKLPQPQPDIDAVTGMSCDNSSQSSTNVFRVVEDDSNSNATNDSFRVKKGRMEVNEYSDSAKELGACDIAEYQWPIQGGELYMIQEQISNFLNVKMFKRKYPDIHRRPVDMEEKAYLVDSGLVSEGFAMLGLTAVVSAEILDVMCADFSEKYEELRKYMREKQALEQSFKKKAWANELGYKLMMTDGSRLDTKMRAMESVASWNASLNKNRREERRCALDLQTYVIHHPQSKREKMSFPTPKVGSFPVAILPGQYCDHYDTYSADELRYMPVNTAMYGPVKFNRTDLDYASDDSGSDINCDFVPSESSSSSSSSDSEEEVINEADPSVNTPMEENKPIEKDEKEEIRNEEEKTNEENKEDEEKKEETKGETEEVEQKVEPEENVVEEEPVIEEPRIMPRRSSAFSVCCKMCGGNRRKNKKNVPEILIKCAKCLLSSHPTCLDLSLKMVKYIQKYKWLCANCKTCLKCKKNKDEDKTIFCDLCDRAYHIYCVGLDEVPSGEWNCLVCLEEGT